MPLTLDDVQKIVDERVQKTPFGYFPYDKIFEKWDEERGETRDALMIYENSPTEENMKALKTEIGDVFFAMICLVNKKGISLEECFDLMIKKNQERAKNDYRKEDKSSR